jgi:hypothetical protein
LAAYPIDKTNHKLYFSLHGVTCSLESGEARFQAFAHSFLPELLSKPIDYPKVFVRLHWGKQPDKTWWSSKTLCHGRRLWQFGSRILITELIELPGLQIETSWEGDKLVVEAYYTPPGRFGQLALRFNRNSIRIFFVLFYHLVYLPIFAYLSYRRGWHLLHAGATSLDGTVQILAGLPGSGKSTLSLSLLHEQDTRLISDNLLLFDRANVYACPEPLYLSPEIINWLPPTIVNRQTGAHRNLSHGRREFQLLPETRLMQAKPSQLYFVRIGKETACRSIHQNNAFVRLSSYEHMAKEIQAYEIFMAALDLISPQDSEYTETNRCQVKLADLEALITGLECFELDLEKDRKLTYAVNLLKGNAALKDGRRESPESYVHP